MKKSVKELEFVKIAVFALGMALISCTSTNSSGDVKVAEVEAPVESVEQVVEEPLNVETVSFIPNEENVKFLGRSVFEGNQLMMCYSSTGAEFNINAKRLDITIGGDTGANSGNKTGAARIVVFVNGERKLDEMIRTRTATFTVFNQKEAVEGLVQVLKVSECANSIAALKKITLDKDGTISPAAKKDLKIEFIGDSITCGYGVDDLVKEHHFSTETEDNTKTYAYKTAKALDADYSMVSLSGWGIISGFSGDGSKVGNMALPKVYSKLGNTWGSSIGGKNPGNMEWNFELFKPDVVVVNLGTNDASYTKGNDKKIEEYKNAYVEFLKDIRAKNPDAYIICALGIMGSDLYPAVEKTVAEYQAASGDSKVTALKFANQSMGDGIAADWHPSEKTHEKAAVLLTAKIKEVLGVE